LLLAGAVPLIFLHATYQPTLSIPVGSTSIDLTLADLAVAVLAGTAGMRLARSGLQLLRPAAFPLLAAAAFLLVALLACFTPLVRGEEYALLPHLVSASKLAWYALLAPAVIVLVETRRDGVVLARAMIAWSLVATGWGALQFLGIVDEFEGKRPGQREPSFVGIHDFAALSGAALALGIVGLALRDEPVGRRWSLAGLAGGGIGLILSGAMTGVMGIWLAAVAVIVLTVKRRELGAAAATAIVVVLLTVTLGTTVMRASAIERFAEFLGIRDRVAQESGVQSYAHRTLLAYIGLRIFRDNPVVGVGWQASSESFAYTPYLAAAHRRFAGEPAQAFPSPEHPWGVQNAYIETLADLGIVGLAALVLAFGSALATGIRRASETPLALVGLTWLLVATGIWMGIGLVAGIPLVALTWLGFGLVNARA
jgi:hypothetical protein